MAEKQLMKKEKKITFSFLRCAEGYFPKKRLSMKIVKNILIISILTSFLFTCCTEARSPEGRKDVQVGGENINQQKKMGQKQIEGKPKEQNQKEKEPQLVWQKDFGTEILRFKLHKEIDATDFPILAVETEDTLVIFDKRGNEKIKRPIPKNKVVIKGKEEIFRGYVSISDNGEYVLEGKGIPESSYDLKYTTIDGKTLWKKKNFYGVPVVSPDGSVVVLLDVEGGKNKKGSVEFYDSSGKLLKKYPMELGKDIFFPYSFSFSEDGNYCALRLEHWVEEKSRRMPIYPIILFDKQGDLLWRKNIEVGPERTSIWELLISPNANRIGFSSDKYIFIVDKQGNLLWKKEFHNLLVFSKKKNLLLMVMKGEKFSLVDATTGKEIQSIHFRPERLHPMISPEISLDGSSIAIITARKPIPKDKDTLYILKLIDKEIRIFFKKEYPFYFVKKVQFSRDNSCLYFVGQVETKLSIYKFTL